METYTNYMGFYIWPKIFVESFQKCHRNLIETNSIDVQLLDLTFCLKTETSKNCLQFKTDEGCMKTEKFYEDCLREKETCETWPSRLTETTITTCCNQPTLVSRDKSELCELNCTFSDDSYDCKNNCIFEGTKLILNEDLNMEALNAALNENRDPNVKWDKVIDDSVDFCIKHLKGLSFFI